jgi:hypothetical protein
MKPAVRFQGFEAGDPTARNQADASRLRSTTEWQAAEQPSATGPRPRSREGGTSGRLIRSGNSDACIARATPDHPRRAGVRRKNCRRCWKSAESDRFSNPGSPELYDFSL